MRSLLLLPFAPQGRRGTLGEQLVEALQGVQQLVLADPPHPGTATYSRATHIIIKPG